MTPRRAWTAVLLLTLVGTFNVVDRILPSVLNEQIKHDLQLSDTAIGLINGFGFLVIYAVVGIPIARFADRGRYGFVIGICLGLWSMMTALGGLAQSGVQLALARMGVALGEAGSSPAAHAFISRNFAPDKRGTPLALLTLSTPFSIIIAMALGGIGGEILGWRMTFVIVGVAGMILAPIVFFALNAQSGGPLAEAPQTAEREAAMSWRGSALFILLATACVGIGGYAMTAFGPAYLMRAHGFSVSQVGVQYGLIAGGIGIVGLLTIGFVSDRLSARDMRWLLWLMPAVITVVVPFSIWGFITGSAGMALAGAAITNIVATIYMAPTVAALHRLVPPGRRATASAVLLFCTALPGGLGPLLAGMVSDALAPTYGPRGLGFGLLIIPVAFSLAAVFYMLAARRFREQVYQ